MPSRGDQLGQDAGVVGAGRGAVRIVDGTGVDLVDLAGVVDAHVDVGPDRVAVTEGAVVDVVPSVSVTVPPSSSGLTTVVSSSGAVATVCRRRTSRRRRCRGRRRRTDRWPTSARRADDLAQALGQRRPPEPSEASSSSSRMPPSDGTVTPCRRGCPPFGPGVPRGRGRRHATGSVTADAARPPPPSSRPAAMSP